MQDSSTNAQRIGAVATILVCTAILFGTFVTIAKLEATQVMEPYNTADNIISKAVHFHPVDTTLIAKDKRNRLVEMYDMIDHKKAHHLEITKMMNAYYFASSLMLAILTIITAVLLLNVADKGMNDKSTLFKIILYTFIGLTTLFLVLINVLDHKENIRVNKQSFLAYSSIQLRIYNYMISDGEALDQNAKQDKTPVNKFIAKVNADVDQLNNLTFVIHHEKIKSYNKIIEEF